MYYITCYNIQIAENEKLQQLSMMPAGQDYAIQAYLSGNVLQLNMMESVPAYPIPDRKTLPLGIYFFMNLAHR